MGNKTKGTAGEVDINYYNAGNVLIGAGGGNVAIGSATPSEKLHVVGRVKTVSSDGGFITDTSASCNSAYYTIANFNGTNGSTSFTDSSCSPLTMTAVGNAQLSTTSPWGGSASLLLDGNGDGVSIGTTNSYNFLHNNSSTGKWLAQGWFKASSFASNQTLFETCAYDSAQAGVMIRLNSARTFIFYMGNAGGGSNWVLNCTSTGTFPNDSNWHHVRATFDGSLGSENGKIFVDGSKLTMTCAKSGSSTSANSAYPLVIGKHATSVVDWNGYIDAFEVKNSPSEDLASNFTPPAAETGSVESGSAGIEFRANGTSKANIITNYASNYDLQIYTNSVPVMTITQGGNVGIGTTLVPKKLSIDGSIYQRGSDCNQLCRIGGVYGCRDTGSCVGF